MKRPYWLPVVLLCCLATSCSSSSGGEKNRLDAGPDTGKATASDADGDASARDAAPRDARAQDARADQAVTPPIDAGADAGRDAEAGLTCTCSKTDQCCDGCEPINEAGSCKSDGLDCTIDLCRKGGCAHELKSGFCLIDGNCYGDGDKNPGNQCRRCDAASDNYAWRDQPNGAACDDGLFCNGKDSCQSGACSKHAGDPCAAKGDSCWDAEDRCCTADSYLACNADGNVASYDSCDREGDVVDDCVAVNLKGACQVGVCGCQPGWAGTDCSRCLIYVNALQADDSKDGASWANAKRTVQAGINAAQPSACEVWVAAGTYLPTEDASGNATPADERTKTVHLAQNVDVYGGFGDDEISREQQDALNKQTVLSGDLGVKDDASDNAYHVVTGASDATLDGFTVTGGNSSGSGGGLYTKTCAGLTVSHCAFQGNQAKSYGGAIYNNGCSPLISVCVFESNTAAQGGAIYNVASSSPTIVNCVFKNNSVAASLGSGGGICNMSGCSPSVTSCVFLENSAATGGGMYSNSGSPIVTNCTFYKNSATDATNAGGALFNANMATATVTNSILWGDSPDEIKGDTTEALTVRYCDIQDVAYQGADGNINFNPLFVNVDPDAGAIDLHLAAGSPCIDAADNAKAPEFDLEGRARFDYPAIDNCSASGLECDGFADMGAYERVSQ